MIERYYEIKARRQHGDEEGFTLIELLIVIVVLGILAAVVVFALGGVTGQSAVAACNSDAKTVETAIAAEQAAYPSVVPTTGNTGNLVEGVTANGVTGPSYLKSWPTNNYYTVGIDTSTTSTPTGQALGYPVEISLTSGDPGYATTSATAPQIYDGQQAYSFPAGVSGIASDSNICAGA